MKNATLALLLAAAWLPLRAAGAEDPIRLLVCGDSLMKTAAERALPRAFDPFPRPVSFVNRISIGTGLARPDVFDWPAQLRAALESGPAPTAAIFLIGANDAQPLRTANGQTAARDSPEWRDEYADRIRAVLDQLVRAGVPFILWIGLPDMRDRPMQDHAGRVNALAREVCAEYPAALFLDAVPLFSRTPGVFTPYILQPSGMPLQVRAADGIHLNPAGAERLSRAVRQALEARLADQ